MAFVVCSVVLRCRPVGRDLARALQVPQGARGFADGHSEATSRQNSSLGVPATSWMWGMGPRHLWDRLPALPSGVEKALGHPRRTHGGGQTRADVPEGLGRLSRRFSPATVY